MVKSSTALVPLVGVLIALMIVTVAPLFTSTELQMPRKLDDGCRSDTETISTIRVYLHADSGITLEIDEERDLVPSFHLMAAVTRALEQHRVEAIYLRPDESVLWQQVVETTASLQHVTELPVALDSAEPGSVHWLEM